MSRLQRIKFWFRQKTVGEDIRLIIKRDGGVEHEHTHIRLGDGLLRARNTDALDRIAGFPQTGCVRQQNREMSQTTSRNGTARLKK